MNEDRLVLYNQIKEEIRLKANIADVVGRYVTLKSAGQNFKGLCPFHKEKTPSFTVNPDKGIFHCFGCGKGGDVFTFVMEIEGIDFPEAMERLAEETGVKLLRASDRHEENGYPQEHGPTVSKTRMYEINEIAAAFFYQSLKSSQKAIDYFKSRGIRAETVKEFVLGYAPPGWSSLIDYAGTKGVSGAELVASGLALSKSETSAPYDRFRDRIVFTISDNAGKTIAFAARAFEPDAQPKYLNSPETPLYHKSRTLYGLHKARQFIKEKNALLIVEGYMDYLALYQAGVKNVAATCGTALSTDHGSIIRRFTNRLFLVFDGDSAGVNAARKALFTLAPLNLSIRVLILPDDEDPDSFVKKYGVEKFNARLEAALDATAFLIDKVASELSTDTAQGKSAVVRELMPYLGALSDPIVRSEFVKELGERLDITETVINGELKNSRSTQTQAPRQPDAAGKPVASFLGTLERNFLRLLTRHPAFIDEAKQYIAPETLTDVFCSNIYSLLIRAYANDPTLSGLLESAQTPDEKSFITAVFSEGAEESDAHEELMHTVLRLQGKFLKRRIRDIQKRMTSEPDNRAVLLKQLQDFSTQLKELE